MRNANAKLSDDDIREIRAVYAEAKAAGRRPKRKLLAQRFNVAPQTIQKIGRGLTWKGVK